jgi:hypothetical protein
MSAPVDESTMPVSELLARAWSFLQSSKGTAGELVWEDAFDALLDRMLDENPRLRVV